MIFLKIYFNPIVFIINDAMYLRDTNGFANLMEICSILKHMHYFHNPYEILLNNF